MINEKTKIKHLDILLLSVEDIGSFNIYLTLKKGIGEDTDNFEIDKLKWFNSLHDAVKNFGLTHKYFKPIDFYTYRLTEKGIKAKEIGGHLEYLNFAKKTPLNTYQTIYLSFFILFGLLGIYKVFQPTVSVDDFKKLNSVTKKTPSLFLEYNYFNNLLHLCFCYSLMDYKYISSPAILSH